MTNRNTLTKKDYIIGLTIALIYIVILIATSKEIGFVRDEGYYFKAAELYNGWFVELWENTKKGKPLLSFTKANIDKYFNYNHEHPALMKEHFGFSWQIFTNKIGITNNSTGFRLPGMFSAGLLLFLMYLFGAEFFNRRVAIFSTLMMAVIPRFWFHSHLACFDVPITAMWFFTVYAFTKSLYSFKWAVLTGIIFGFALATKHNAYFIPFLLIIYVLYLKHNDLRFFREKDGGVSLSIPSIPTAFLFMLIFGPVILVAHWPYLWPAVLERLGTYINYHLHHEHYPVSYFNVTYDRPPLPISYPYVITAITVPATIWILGTLGSFRTTFWLIYQWIKKQSGIYSTLEKRAFMLLILLNAFFPIFLISLPSVPIFGGVKHWLNAMPYFCILGALEFETLLKFIVSIKPTLIRFSRHIQYAVISLVTLTGILGIIYIHPVTTGFYNEFVRGVRGAADLEMQRKFWGFAGYYELEFINKNLPPNSSVYFQRTNYDSYRMYQRDGFLRKDINYANEPNNATAATFHFQKGYMKDLYKTWMEFGNKVARHGTYIDEAPMVQTYIRSK